MCFSFISLLAEQKSHEFLMSRCSLVLRSSTDNVLTLQVVVSTKTHVSVDHDGQQRLSSDLNFASDKCLWICCIVESQ